MLITAVVVVSTESKATSVIEADADQANFFVPSDVEDRTVLLDGHFAVVVYAFHGCGPKAQIGGRSRCWRNVPPRVRSFLPVRSPIFLCTFLFPAARSRLRPPVSASRTLSRLRQADALTRGNRACGLPVSIEGRTEDQLSMKTNNLGVGCEVLGFLCRVMPDFCYSRPRTQSHQPLFLTPYHS